MQIAYPFAKPYRVTDDFAAHVARNSTAPGIDFAAPMQTPILAPFYGTVRAAKTYTLGGRGLWIHSTEHPNAQVYYAHLSCLCLLAGEPVKPGQVIGYTGRTGNATGPCLHFSLELDGAYTDPAPYLSQPPDAQSPAPPLPLSPSPPPSLAWAHTVPREGRVEMELDEAEENIIIEAHAAAGQHDTLDDAVREPAYRFLQVPRNEGAALLKYARAHDLGAAITPEFYITMGDVTYCSQGYALALVTCVKDDWANIQHIDW